MRDPRRLRYRQFRKKTWLSNLSVTGWLILINVAFFIITFPFEFLSENYID